MEKQVGAQLLMATNARLSRFNSILKEGSKMAMIRLEEDQSGSSLRTSLQGRDWKQREWLFYVYLIILVFPDHTAV